VLVDQNRPELGRVDRAPDRLDRRHRLSSRRDARRQDIASAQGLAGGSDKGVMSPLRGRWSFLWSFLWSRLTYANAMSSIAVFIALGGGAYALSVPKRSVGSKQLRPGAVTTSKVRDRSLRAKDFKRGQLPALSGTRAGDMDPPVAPGTTIASADIETKADGQAFVLATVRDVFVTCGETACDAQWGVYVDDRPVRSTGLRLHGDPGASDGFSFYTLYGPTVPLPAGKHTVKLAFTTTGAPVSAGQLGAQIGAFALGG
jgi:hypothetical protein